jgi:NADH-quinone oxidoreductase subunit I
MNCGLCAEFCPFDAIKMNHDYEIAAYHRMPSLVFDLQELRVPTTYYARLRPTDWAAEEAARRAEAEAKAAKAAARPAAAAAAPATASAAAAPDGAAPAATAAPAARVPLTPEEIERRKAEVAAKRAAAQAAASPPPAPAGDGQEEK